MPRIPLDPQWEPDDDGWVQPPAPLLPPPSDLTVYDVDPEPAGWLWLPGDVWVEVLPERDLFGFARYLQGGNMGKPSVREQLAALSRSATPRCGVGRALAAMSDSERAEFEDVLADLDVAGTAIAAVFDTRGHHVRAHTVQDHRRGKCSCGR